MRPRSSWFERAPIALIGALIALGVAAREAPGVIGAIAMAELPREARETLVLIKRGGPFPYRKDGTVFQNRERRLPAKPRGYYTEYTVRTPGSRDRGPRRIVAGRGATGDPATGGEYWYTGDHYETFRRIRE
jgi:ribonuclease T1